VAPDAARRHGPTALPDPAQKVAYVDALFDAIAPRYDVMNRLMTFGLDLGWRRRAIGALGLPRGALVLDVASGTGDCLGMLARRGMRAVGLDRSAGMLAVARARHEGATLVLADAGRMPFLDGSFDGAVCSFGLRNFADARGVLEELARVVRPGGRLALLEVAPPQGGARGVLHRWWLGQVAPWLGAKLSSREAYEYLPASLAYLPSPTELRQLLCDVGFSGANHRVLGLGAAQLYTATRRGVPRQRTVATAPFLVGSKRRSPRER
jgi:demethylmenaquinone methyltransferase/2-methoxy-6-polyprenyl-1,4-benzoquinol methylase